MAFIADEPASGGGNGEILAAMDIGTNSIRMSLVRLDRALHSWSVLSTYKETVRLGQDEFASHHIGEEAIARGVGTLARFAEIARGRGASEVIAIATAALREAENRDEFIQRAWDDAKVEVRVAPGVEEARLIYLGVASGVELGERKALFIDIGGGSTELIVGDQTRHYLLESLKLGAIRLGNRFLTGVTGPVSPELYDTMRQYARRVATHAYRKIEEQGFEIAVASSGTAMNLAQVVARRAGLDLATVRNYTLQVSDLREVASYLCGLTLEERRKVPGLNPERADIIVSGAAVLETLATDLGAESLLISDRSLREGVYIDALLRRVTRADTDSGGADDDNTPVPLAYEAGVRRRSIENLARLNERELTHTRHVTFLTLRLYDDLSALGLLPGCGPRERELLEYAALLHDIGIFVSHSGHHRHSYYLIRHSELAGFTDVEVAVIANLAYFHRKSGPKKRHAHFQSLPRDTQGQVRRLSLLLRLAEGLDRSHLSLVRDVHAALAPLPAPHIALTLDTRADPHLNWNENNEEVLFEEAFGIPLALEP